MVALHEPLTPEVRSALNEHDELVAGLLARRGITTKEAAEAFLSPSYDAHVHDPFLMKNMRKAVERIVRAIDAKENIVVWSDYDCDGIPGGVILHDFLQKAGAQFQNYIPNRNEEGFGVNVLGIEKLARQGTQVLITVDCGITDTEAIQLAQTHGIDVIVTDHHTVPEIPPPAFAIINPKQDGETYPFRELCGAGLAFKLVCGVLAHARERGDAWGIPLGWEKWLLDMAGLATIADMVPLIGENRVLAKYGLLVMRKSPRVGLQKLCAVARVNQRYITEDDVAFMLAPRINAASRMGDPKDAFNLFTTSDESLADSLAKGLEKANRSRRSAAGAITRAVNERVEERKQQGTLPPVLVFGDPSWRPSLLGLVANAVAEVYERPVFLWGREGGTVLKGSCRSGVHGVSVVHLMETAQDAFIQFGGHHVSGGFSVKDDQVFTLEERLVDAFHAIDTQTHAEDVVKADALLSLSEATAELLQTLSRLAPFGVGNERPVFGFNHLTLSRISWFGKGEEHIKLTLTSDGFDALEAVAFYARRELGSGITKLSRGARVHVLGSLERDQFSKGRPVRLRLLSVK